MILLLRSPKKSEKFILFFSILASLFIIQYASAQDQADSAKILLASIEKNAGPGYFIKKSNLVFPEILKGNEEEMLPYIENFSVKKRDYVHKMYAKGKGFLPRAATILKKYSLPEELKILLALESAFNGNAVSRAGAVGYWQIMDEMARDYDMKYVARPDKAEREKLLRLKGERGGNQHLSHVLQRDDRKNFIKATHTAARYMRDCNQSLDDNWLLVVASYNCGLGKVKRAIKKCGIENPTFWDIKNYLPSETKTFVRNFITLSVIFNNYEKFASNKLTFVNEKIIVHDDLDESMTKSQPEF